MKHSIYISNDVPVGKQPFEIVERKGIGHPDTICDSVMNRISVELSKRYYEDYGEVLHHNLDKALLAAGKSKVQFGGGKIIEPMRLFMGDRATSVINEKEYNIPLIAKEVGIDWFLDNMKQFDPFENIEFISCISEGSIALQNIFEREPNDGYLGANDTSASVGYAPYSKLEDTLLFVESELQKVSRTKRFNFLGEDIKIMGIRKNQSLDLTVASAMLDTHISSSGDYVDKKLAVEEYISYLIGKKGWHEHKIIVNALDDEEQGINGLYLTTTGTSAESGDSGQVGRGNNVKGVIPMNRPGTAEAAPGKNPVSHVGKIYNVFANNIAEHVVEYCEYVSECYVWMVSKIGQPIDKPSLLAVRPIVLPSNNDKIYNKVREVVEWESENFDTFLEQLLSGKYSVC